MPSNGSTVQSEQFQRLGVMGDWDDPYLTMKFEAEAKIVEELLKFAESGQLYRGAKPVMWSPVEKTALAEAEVEYEDIVSTQIDVGVRDRREPDPPSWSARMRWSGRPRRGRSRSTRRSLMGRTSNTSLRLWNGRTGRRILVSRDG